jgi:formamidopyrimidine-DNA glycosylase
MPELPEVELHARLLRTWLAGRRITGYKVLDPLLLDGQDAAAWQVLPGSSVPAVRREAKYLLIDLDTPAGPHALVAHLRMTGKFLRDAYTAEPAQKPTRLTLTLDNGERLRFDDRRRFGRAHLLPAAELAGYAPVASLGPDALLAPTSPERLREITARTSRSIKALLMDQRLIGGLGNICAIEILYRAGIAPDTPSKSLTDAQVADITRITPDYLEWAIDAQSRRKLISLSERGAENVFTLYRRGGQPCPQCGTPIARSVIAGRGTYYCPECQK